MQIEGPPLGVDLALLGIVFALVLFILVFSAMVLYVAFRVKETFRGESRRGIVIAKVAFLIGVLFLAAGGFYFLAQVLLPRAPPVPVGPQLSLTLSYPVQVTRDAGFNVSFTVTNPTDFVAHDAVIQTGGLFQDFTLLNSSHEVSGNIVTVGDVSKGTVVVSLQLAAPSVPGNFEDSIALSFTESDSAQIQLISITVTGGP